MKSSEDENDLPELQDCLNVGIFSGLEREVRRHFASSGTVKMFPVGAFIAKQSEPQDVMGVVVEGEVSVTCHAHGDIVHLANIGPGGLVGEMSLIDRHPASADVIVKDEPAKLWTIRYEDFDSFLDNHPTVGLKVYRIIAGELCRLIRCNSESMLHSKDTMRSRFLDMDY